MPEHPPEAGETSFVLSRAAARPGPARLVMVRPTSATAGPGRGRPDRARGTRRSAPPPTSTIEVMQDGVPVRGRGTRTGVRLCLEFGRSESASGALPPDDSCTRPARGAVHKGARHGRSPSHPQRLGRRHRRPAGHRGRCGRQVRLAASYRCRGRTAAQARSRLVPWRLSLAASGSAERRARRLAFGRSRAADATASPAQARVVRLTRTGS